MTSRRSFLYPTDHLLAVFDEPTDAAHAAAGLVAAAFPAADVTILRGTEGVERLAPSGGRERRWARLLRAVQYVTMDQMPDFPAYVAALRDGRAIVAVRIRGGRGRMLEARARLEADGAHFMNFFGRYATEELSRWRGPELPLPDHLRR